MVWPASGLSGCSGGGVGHWSGEHGVIRPGDSAHGGSGHAGISADRAAETSWAWIVHKFGDFQAGSFIQKKDVKKNNIVGCFDSLCWCS